MKRVALLVAVAACANPTLPPGSPHVAAATTPSAAPSVPAPPPPPDAMPVDAGPIADWYCVHTNGKVSVCAESLEDCKEEIEENNLRDHHCTHVAAAYCVYLDYDTGTVGRQCMPTHDECMVMFKPAIDHASDRLAPEDRSCEREPGR